MAAAHHSASARVCLSTPISCPNRRAPHYPGGVRRHSANLDSAIRSRAAPLGSPCSHALLLATGGFWNLPMRPGPQRSINIPSGMSTTASKTAHQEQDGPGDRCRDTRDVAVGCPCRERGRSHLSVLPHRPSAFPRRHRLRSHGPRVVLPTGSAREPAARSFR